MDVFIIGNGFDIQHCIFQGEKNRGLNSLRDFVRNEDYNVYEKVTKIVGDDWGSFEDYSIDEVLEIDVLKEFNRSLINWVKYLNEKISKEKYLENKDNKEEFERLSVLFSNAAMIVNLNYTLTVEKIYGIEDVFHIHGTEDQPYLALNRNTALNENFSLERLESPFIKETHMLSRELMKKLKCNYPPDETKEVNIYIYGFSSYQADSVYIESIFNSYVGTNINVILPEHQASDFEKYGDELPLNFTLRKFICRVGHNIKVMNFDNKELKFKVNKNPSEAR